MRQIKFRAWAITKRSGELQLAKMIYPTGTSPAMEALCFVGTLEGGWFHAGGDPVWFEETIAVMQYTGMTDREGREIYEGDIVEFPTRRNIFISIEHGNAGGDEKDLPKTWYSEVEFIDGAFTWEWKHGYEGQCVFPEDVKVVGNIYEENE